MAILIDSTESIYRDLSYINYEHLDNAIKITDENFWIANNRSSSLSKKLSSGDYSEADLGEIIRLRDQANLAAIYWEWCNQGLKDIRYQDHYEPQFLRKALSDVATLPEAEALKFKGYHDGFYFGYFRKPDDSHFLEMIDSEWGRRKIMFGPPPLDETDLKMFISFEHNANRGSSILIESSN